MSNGGDYQGSKIRAYGSNTHAHKIQVILYCEQVCEHIMYEFKEHTASSFLPDR